MSQHINEIDGGIRAIAPAKINLFLHITGRRANGYHELESLFAFTETGDVIEARPSDSLSLEIVGPFAESLVQDHADGSENLVTKAARLLAAEAGRLPHAQLRLSKNLPIASGIGGGSSDAAAALLALTRLWQLELSAERLATIALELGADVPACLHRSPLYVQGIGEKITCRSLPIPFGVLLVNPLVEISTPSIFRAFKEDQACHFDVAQNAGFCWPCEATAFVDFLKCETRNALQRTAVSLEPEINNVLDTLDRQKGVKYSAMSGSGATCFALFETLGEAEVAATCIKEQSPAWWVMADRLIPGVGA